MTTYFYLNLILVTLGMSLLKFLYQGFADKYFLGIYLNNKASNKTKKNGGLCAFIE